VGSRIAGFRRKVALGQYELTGHAKDEMEQDAFTIHDVKAVVYSGTILMTQRHGAGRRKYLVRGQALDGRQMDVVCRLTEMRRLRIITVFAVRS
jgi:uncharacterized DUF497 family protein